MHEQVTCLGDISSFGRWRWRLQPGTLRNETNNSSEASTPNLGELMPVPRNETLEHLVKSSLIKLALTVGALATALLAGAASLRVG